MSANVSASCQSRPIRFFHRGEIVSVEGVHPTRSVLDWLREDAHQTGTKEGCNEGDCGACTVVLGELDGSGNLKLQTVNSCIQFLPTVDGKALFTVEDLELMRGAPKKPADEVQPKFHPVQQAMVDCHGAQCGFCTPGILMSLWSAYERHQEAGTRPTRQELADDLAGNLCRCTGYRPILDAGQEMFDLPAVRLDRQSVIKALKELQQDPPLDYSGTQELPDGSRREDHFYAPRTLEQLAALRAAQPKARLLAGCTDIGIWVNKLFRDVGDLIYTGNVTELQRIEERPDELYIGAAASLESAWHAVVKRAPALEDVWFRFASPPIRHAGTMGGNVANGSPIGDSAPILEALDASVELRAGSRVRRLALTDFYLDYMKNALQEGEFVQGIVVPLAAFRRSVHGYKVSKRFDSDISATCAGMSIDLDASSHVHSVRLAFGGLAAIVKRAEHAEAAIAGRPWTEDTLRQAQQALAQDFQPMTDMRASAEYRLQVAQNLLERLWLETRKAKPLARNQTNVFDVMPHVIA
jgi:xanthine dehydrogenase small subunit